MPISDETKQAVVAKLQELLATDMGQEIQEKVQNLIAKFQALDEDEQEALIENVKAQVHAFIENAKANLSEEDAARIQEICQNIKAHFE